MEMISNEESGFELQKDTLYINVHTGSVDYGYNWIEDILTEEDYESLFEVYS